MWVAYRRIPEGGACDFCLILATRGAVYRSAETAGAGHSYHHHCRCSVEPEADYDAQWDTFIPPEDANRVVSMWNRPRNQGGHRYTYDLAKHGNRAVGAPPSQKPPAPIRAKVADLPGLSPQKPESLAAAITRTNPKFAYGAVEYRENCTRCVVAAEMRVRGYSVAAAPRPTGDLTLKVFQDVFVHQSRSLRAPRSGRLSSIAAEVSTNERGQRDTSIVARLWIRWSWSSGGGGHVLTGEIRNGKLTLYDPQTGTTHPPGDFAGRVKDIQYVRVDDLGLSPTGAVKYVVERQE